MPGLRAALVTPLTGKLTGFGRAGATALRHRVEIRADAQVVPGEVVSDVGHDGEPVRA